MASRKLPDLTPLQVVALKDALLANADSLLTSALSVLEAGNPALARSLAILGLEESGKAIAIHRRQVYIAYDEEGAPFVDERITKLWASHPEKLNLVHEFLVEESYWFDSQPPDREENLSYLGELGHWTKNHNLLKHRGFYVDLEADGEVLSPSDSVDVAALTELIGRVHQIGWQLRLGEHIEAKGQAEAARDVPPASQAEIESMHEAFRSLEPSMLEDMMSSMREGHEGRKLNNREYRLHLPATGSNPFENVGAGYEAETRELARLAEEVRLDDLSGSD